MPDPKYADETVIRGAQIMTPELANFAGNVHGGHLIMAADNLAYACATRFAGLACTTAAIDRVDLLAPVHVGELLHLTAQVVHAGQTSLEVEVTIEAENVSTGDRRLTGLCAITLVALRDGRAAPVPSLVPRTREDKIRFLRARERLDAARAERAAERHDPFADLADADLDSRIVGG
ncbi:MAG: acyl-CoA thioesterase [Dehalococcoidia bacterium]